MYPPTDEHVLAQLSQSLLGAPRLQRDLIDYYLLLYTDTVAAQEFAAKRHLTQIHTQRTRAFCLVDRGQYADAVRILSKPGAWSGFIDEETAREYQDVVLDILAVEATPTLVNTFIEGSGMVRDSPARREYSVRALAGEQGRLREAWRYVRDLEFQDDMVAGEEIEAVEGDEMDVDDEERAEKQAQAVQDERKRLLAVMLDAILIRKSARLSCVPFSHSSCSASQQIRLASTRQATHRQLRTEIPHIIPLEYHVFTAGHLVFPPARPSHAPALRKGTTRTRNRIGSASC